MGFKLGFGNRTGIPGLFQIDQLLTQRGASMRTAITMEATQPLRRKSAAEAIESEKAAEMILIIENMLELQLFCRATYRVKIKHRNDLNFAL